MRQHQLLTERTRSLFRTLSIKYQRAGLLSASLTEPKPSWLLAILLWFQKVLLKKAGLLINSKDSKITKDKSNKKLRKKKKKKKLRNLSQINQKSLKLSKNRNQINWKKRRKGLQSQKKICNSIKRNKRKKNCKKSTDLHG